MVVKHVIIHSWSRKKHLSDDDYETSNKMRKAVCGGWTFGWTPEKFPDRRNIKNRPLDDDPWCKHCLRVAQRDQEIVTLLAILKEKP